MLLFYVVGENKTQVNGDNESEEKCAIDDIDRAKEKQNATIKPEVDEDVVKDENASESGSSIKTEKETKEENRSEEDKKCTKKEISAETKEELDTEVDMKDNGEELKDEQKEEQEDEKPVRRMETRNKGIRPVKKEDKTENSDPEAEEEPESESLAAMKEKVMSPKPAIEPAVSKSETGWHVICSTLDDWINLAEWFKDSPVRCEKSLSKVIREDFLPVLPEIIEARVSTVQVFVILLCVFFS